jgi:hypothetical protein
VDEILKKATGSICRSCCYSAKTAIGLACVTGASKQGEMRVVEQQETEAAQARFERIPFMQRILDNPFVLLFAGVVIPTVVYILWGVMEITQIPLAK